MTDPGYDRHHLPSPPRAPAPLSGGDARTQLAEESGKHRPKYKGESWPWGDGAAYVGCICGWLRVDGVTFEEHRADALLPVVERIADERAAEALDRVEKSLALIGLSLSPEISAASLRAANRGETGR